MLYMDIFGYILRTGKQLQGLASKCSKTQPSDKKMPLLRKPNNEAEPHHSSSE